MLGYGSLVRRGSSDQQPCNLGPSVVRRGSSDRQPCTQSGRDEVAPPPQGTPQFFFQAQSAPQLGVPSRTRKSDADGDVDAGLPMVVSAAERTPVSTVEQARVPGQALPAARHHDLLCSAKPSPRWVSPLSAAPRRADGAAQKSSAPQGACPRAHPGGGARAL